MNTSGEERFSMISEEQMEETLIKEEKISFLSDESPKCNIIVKHCKNQSLYRQEQFQSCQMLKNTDETQSLIDKNDLLDDHMNFSSSIDFMKNHQRSQIVSGGSVLANY
jgi:hypothetical protein